MHIPPALNGKAGRDVAAVHAEVVINHDAACARGQRKHVIVVRIRQNLIERHIAISGGDGTIFGEREGGVVDCEAGAVVAEADIRPERKPAVPVEERIAVDRDICAQVGRAGIRQGKRAVPVHVHRRVEVERGGVDIHAAVDVRRAVEAHLAGRVCNDQPVRLEGRVGR